MVWNITSIQLQRDYHSCQQQIQQKGHKKQITLNLLLAFAYRNPQKSQMKRYQDISIMRNWFYHAYRLRDKKYVCIHIYTSARILALWRNWRDFRHGHKEGSSGDYAALRTPHRSFSIKTNKSKKQGIACFLLLWLQTTQEVGRHPNLIWWRQDTPPYAELASSLIILPRVSQKATWNKPVVHTPMTKFLSPHWRIFYIRQIKNPVPWHTQVFVSAYFLNASISSVTWSGSWE